MKVKFTRLATLSPGRVLSLGIILMLVSCSPRIIEHTVVQHDTTTIHKRDSIVLRDSIYIREWVKGDTVFVDRFRDRYIYRDRWRDSISIREVHDTTSVNKLVEKPLSWSQKVKLDSFWWLILMISALLGWTFREPIVKLLKTILK